MSDALKISVGQHSDKGRKEISQDFHGVYIPTEPQLSTKGIAVALADGISSSQVSQVASESAVRSFLDDYYCTSDAWSVKTSAQRVLTAANSWLHSQTQQSAYRFDKDRGYVCTLSAMILKSTTAHIFHVGDTRIFRVQGSALEQLTNDHRVFVSPEQSYLSRALGIDSHLEIEYRTLPVEQDDVFVLATDGVYEFADARFITDTIHGNADDLNRAAKIIVDEAYEKGSTDNLTVQIVKIDTLPELEANEIYQQAYELPLPPLLDARMEFDGYKIIRELHGSSRSHIYLAVDNESEELVVIKIPSIDLRNNPAYLERFLMEEWVARRINNAHVLKPCRQTRKRSYLYVASEFIDGQTLAQWMIDNPKPDLETVRGIVEQISKGLRAFHRQEMLHQDVRPENIMIDKTGTVKIIDFGSVNAAGVTEAINPIDQESVLGTVQYAAPEYFVGEEGTARSDIFSLGAITYQMLAGRLPYGTQVAKCRTKAAQSRLQYDSVLDDHRDIPAWIDEVLKKAVHPNPDKRYEEFSEFIYDLRHPSKEFLSRTRRPLIERNPVTFWKGVSAILAAMLIALVIKLAL